MWTSQQINKQSSPHNAMLKLAAVVAREVGKDKDLTCQEVGEGGIR
jgi:hypothetical protein